MRVAIVHDYVVNRGGAEKVTLALHRTWPQAPLFTALFHPETTFEEFAGVDVRTSRLQRYSKDPESFRRFLPVFGRAMRGLKIEGFDVTISSSTGFGHHVRPRGGCHIVYCHNPPRFLWDERYEHASVAPRWARPMLPLVLMKMRRADRHAAKRAHLYVANSRTTAERIARVYGRRSVVVYPPVEIERFAIGPRTGDHYMMVGRLLGHRNMDLAVTAFTRMNKRLIVVGDGPFRAELERIAGPTIEFRGAVDDATLAKLYGTCRGTVVPEVADFGIVPVESMASGRPVIALGAGGVRETVRDGVHGVLYKGETVEAVIGAIERAEGMTFDPAALRAHAERFGEAAFAARMRELVDHQLSSCIECARGRRVVRLPRSRKADPQALDGPPDPPDAGAM